MKKPNTTIVHPNCKPSRDAVFPLGFAEAVSKLFRNNYRSSNKQPELDLGAPPISSENKVINALIQTIENTKEEDRRPCKNIGNLLIYCRKCKEWSGGCELYSEQEWIYRLITPEKRCIRLDFPDMCFKMDDGQVE